MLRPGALIDRYELVCPIGEGGMAEVWVAREREPHPPPDARQRLFALKAIRTSSAADPAFREMFLEEARIASSIVHPNVAQVFERGEADGRLYLVLEYVDGEALAVLAGASGTLPPALALRVMADVCAGLEAAHRLAIVHRDVSPQNVLVGVNGEVKLIDFGIAHAKDRAITDTAYGSAKGKLHYMAPEQALRAPLGPTTDVYGAGATLYRLLAGRPAIDGGSDAATMSLLMTRAAAAPLPPSVPRPAAAIVMRALAPEPQDRFASAGAMRDAIERALDEMGEIGQHDVAAWVTAHLSPATRARREALANEPSGEPRFMDVRALASAAAASPPPVERKPVTPAIVGAGPIPKRRRPGLVLGGMALLLGGFAAAALLAPGFVKAEAIARARAIGVELQVGSAAVGLQGVVLHDVRARIPRVPELVDARIETIEVVGLSAREIRVRGLDARFDGPLPKATSALVSLAEDARHELAGSPDAPHRYVLVSGRCSWTSPFGKDTRLEAGPLGADIDSRGAGLEEIRGSIGRFDVTTSKSVLGPWSLSFERAHDAARARLLFDPPLMDGPSVLVVWPRTGATHVTSRVARSPLAHLGLRPAELGLPADGATEVDLAFDGDLLEDGHVDGRGRLDVFAARLPGLPGAVDVRIQAGGKGELGSPLLLEDTRVTIGPFVARVDGTLDVSAERARLDTTWRTDPIPCETIAKREAAKLGSFVVALQDLAKRTGAARVTGTARAAGGFRFDTSRPDEPSLTYTTRESCGLSLFGM